MSSRWDGELAVALAAVQQASRLCAAVQSQITGEVLAKKDQSPVTIADFGSQAVICRALQAALPDDPVVGEEDASELRDPAAAPFLMRVQQELAAVGIPGTADDICGWIDRGNHPGGTGRFWTLDPIDGTKGFLRGEQYAVALALLVDGEIVLGVLGCPNLPGTGIGGTLQWAVRGAGAWQSPLHDAADRHPVRVSDESEPELCRLCESVESGHSAHDRSAALKAQLGIGGESVRMDSQAKYATVARGNAELYLRLPTKADYREKIWDHAAGVLCVQEAGGTVTDIDGRPLDFTCGVQLEQNRGVVASHGRLHDRVLAALAAQFNG